MKNKTKSIVMKSILPVVVTTSVIAGVVVTSRIIDNKNFANEINSHETLSYTEKEISESNEKVALAQEKVKNAENEKQESQKELESAKKEVEAAEKELELAKTEEEKAQAQAKVNAAKEKATKAEQATKEADEKVKQAQEDAKKAEQERQEIESKVNSANQNYSTPDSVESPSPVETPSIVETPSPSPSVSPVANDLETVKTAIENTRNANTMTVTDYTENSTRKFNKSTGEEYAVYRSDFSLTSKAGTLYSYKYNANKTISLFKENGGSEWKMVFSGKRSLGVIELELIKYAYSVESTGEGSYNVKIAHKDAKNWLSSYYGSSSVSGDVTLTVKTNGNYVNYINGTVGTRVIQLAISDVNSTVVPTRGSLGIDEKTINSLEEEYKAHYDCERENDYWVCGPNKHVNQHNF